MNKVISDNTIFPTRLIQGDFYACPIIEDYMSLKPKPWKDILLIVGDGTCVLKDMEAWYEISAGLEYDTMCVNYAALVCPHPFQHFAAGDAHMADMQKVAREIPYPDVIKHGWNPGCKGFDVRWIKNGRGGWNGTSGNLAFKIGLALDYTRIVLAGCPMDNSGNWYRPFIPDNDVKKNKDHRVHLWKWQEIANRPIGRFLRSMSGNTKELFGAPTRNWLLHISEEKDDNLQNN